MLSASIIRYCVCVLAGLLLWTAQPASAQGQNSLSGERICPDGQRAYFGVCPGDEGAKPAPPVSNPTPPQTKTCDYCPEMVRLPGGEFMMGSDKDTVSEKPVHSVSVAAFAIGRYEVTQGQWKAVMGSNPSDFKDCGDDCPVDQVSYNDLQDYIARLNRLTGGRYRLPTEAEWEYACRAGGSHKYCGSDNADAVAWYKSNSGERTHPVGGKQANGFKLYDMSGNVDEWTCSAYTNNGYDGSEKLCSNAVRRVLRGGSWYSDEVRVRSAFREMYDPDYLHDSFGLRLAQD
ncbi:MAG: formylglycine-generating enzyme family protein [Proteobacteria bacterium]|nr:formylglycine-generating enzyme family protein [Pseudomonadota bacterium]